MTHSPTTFLTCLRIMLGPIVRFCIRRGLRAPEAVEVLRGVFVSVASQELTAQGERINTSRLSAMTGLGRRDVGRLEKETSVPLESQSIAARVLGQWQGDRRFLDTRGTPRPLTFGPHESEFKDLVHTVSQDLNATTVLFELERVGSVRRDGATVALAEPEYVSRGDVTGVYLMLARDTADLMAAVEENSFGPEEDLNLHGTTFYDRISPAAAEQVRIWLLREGTRFHDRARAYLAQFDADLNPLIERSPSYLRVSVGTFGVVQPASRPSDEQRIREKK